MARRWKWKPKWRDAISSSRRTTWCWYSRTRESDAEAHLDWATSVSVGIPVGGVLIPRRGRQCPLVGQKPPWTERRQARNHDGLNDSRHLSARERIPRRCRDGGSIGRRSHHE